MRLDPVVDREWSVLSSRFTRKKTLVDHISGLRTLGLGSSVVDVLDREIELVFVAVMGSAIFGPPVGQHALQRNIVLLVEGDHPVVEEIGS
jgi:hypothetical protein